MYRILKKYIMSECILSNFFELERMLIAAVESATDFSEFLTRVEPLLKVRHL